MQCIRKSAKGAVGMEAQMTYQENSPLVAGSSCSCLGQILDGAIDQDALELALVFFLPSCKGTLSGKQHKDPAGLGTLPGFLRSPRLDCSVSFESLPLAFWQGLNPAANPWGCFKDIFHKGHKALPGCPEKRRARRAGFRRRRRERSRGEPANTGPGPGRRFCIPLLLASLPAMAAGEEIAPALQDSWGDFWLFRFFVNAAGYASIVVPGFLLIQYFKRRNYLETGRGICFPVIKSCVFGSEVKSVHQDDGSLPPRAEPTESSTARQVFKLLFCAAGLQISYLTWGVLQERVMTRTYGATETDPGEKFKDSQFLVFMNRILAFTVAGLYCALTKQPRHGAPMYKYSFASLSNILSSWCQYEALKYISFPTQVLAKASKVIPVMMMGKLVSRKSYEYWEYLTAALISVGVSMFLLSSAPNRTVSTVTTFSGIVLLAGYIIFDSFTSNWQDALFTYKMSPVQMMFGVNVFSCLFTVGSLLEQGALLESLRFMARHSEFTAHAVLLSVCSACGQLFIFYTINQFGAAVFTIIMTLRQAFAILLSCLIYGHTVTVVGGLGIAVVFMALFLRVYARSRMKKRSKKLPPGETAVQKV
ncbi:adenosine 3'-phospho 5'-phosphosulfate transporter 1 [Ammospiza nelsoni]|uniref:adenosine 3'-phospho 5'-phosphosulfate transporter 1 n=1 Tax=Ammospiza nelsoni TaxID=2857394 RepID=UPI00286B0043|nr:adenosine 3'-phospho 5'-phosphosulfate transporter 1 [Ammospiza nelsoni]